MIVSDKFVLIVGATGLDRILSVQHFPLPDSKIRTTSHHEMTGGNAANTALAMARLNYKVKLCSKVGDDWIGQVVLRELRRHLDLSLLHIAKACTTGLTTVIVSELEHTRTCLHTPGTCGELTKADLPVDWNQALQNVVHVHCDGRHTEAALEIAKQARQRDIPVSVDIEKDRYSKALDELLQIATLVFTNANQMEDYLRRLCTQWEQEKQRKLEPVVISSNMCDSDMEFFVQTIRPSAFLSRWVGRKQQVVMTKGHLGALSIECNAIGNSQNDSSDLGEMKLWCDHDGMADAPVRVEHTLVEAESSRKDKRVCTAHYTIHMAGVLQDCQVIDTTGAGDAFIGGYLLALLEGRNPGTCLRLGSWVAGQKLHGPGATAALPSAQMLEKSLGKDWSEIESNLIRQISTFRPPIMARNESWEAVQEAGIVVDDVPMELSTVDLSS
jgi:sugar/nucleoside kinase (ribokinase family)